MATNLDLEEQEQLDQLKHFWKQYGNLITWLLVAVLGAYAAWNGWNWWQRDQAVKAGAMFDELDKAAQAGDVERATRVFADLKERFPRTAFTQQGGLLAAKVQFEKGQVDAARATLTWVGEHATETEYQTLAHLRLAAVLMEQKKYDEALKELDAATAKEFEALVADRRGDILQAQGKKDAAKAAYLKAWQTMDPKVEYRRLIDAKLTALGAAPDADKPKTAEASK
ncbi:YfgM family protein [Piscinibacter sp.]|jgi:predicted negative regulator of RcsB-dependent stress response|uniref:YfgM family protein n=1 Tax=Piscinibacter sp. TaxID=1903157 RepID=UPI00355A2D46